MKPGTAVKDPRLNRNSGRGAGNVIDAGMNHPILVRKHGIDNRIDSENIAASPIAKRVRVCLPNSSDRVNHVTSSVEAPVQPVILTFEEFQEKRSKDLRKTAESQEKMWRSKAEKIYRGQTEPISTVSKYRYAMVCSSNVNRSVLAQIALESKKLAVASFGIGTDVKLPGKSRSSPSIFPFGTPYIQMHDQLEAMDRQLYTRNGVLQLLARDATTKRHPERWQDLTSLQVSQFDVIICFENRVFDICLRDLQNREPHEFKPIHVISLPVRDTPVEAEQAMVDVHNLCSMLEKVEDLENQTESTIETFQATTKRSILHQICHI